jgi:hypothetical protein
MRRASVTIASALLALAFGFASCGKSADDSPAHHHEDGGEGAEAATAGAGGTTGEGADGGTEAGGGTDGLGGRGDAGRASGGGSGRGTGGRSSAGSTGAGSGPTGGSGAEGGSDNPGGGGAGGAEPPGTLVCDRLGPVLGPRAADRISFSFERAFFQDCRLSWFSTLYLPPVNERPEFLNHLTRTTLELWGCLEEDPTDFPLVHTAVPLSPAEASTLIELYFNASRLEAQLSPVEIAPIRRALERLAEPLIDETLEDYSRSRCSGGGTGGAGGATGGAGGAPGGAGGLGDGGSIAALL